MKKILPLLFSALALTACGSASSEISFQQISMDAAITQMAEEDNFILLDVRTPEEFADRYVGLTDVIVSNYKMFGFCYTQLYDIEQEQNGLYTYDREKKFD